jgi:lipopolysaccharide/colanic/teichoic acid biosynthesis glycosyltransferase
VSAPSVDSDRGRSAELAAPVLRTSRLRLKRWMDLVIGVPALIILLPVFVLVAIIIRLDSAGPVLFRQMRVGMGGRPFAILKFRTMVCDATDELHRDLVLPLVRGGASDALEGNVGPAPRFYKLAGDPRITRAGRWLRRTSLDELPQLFNVLRGEMSLVGPRPPVTYEYDAYEAWQLQRLAVPQGMTGLWQVSGRNRLSYRRMNELDIEYVRRWSPWLDLKILALTPRAVIMDAEPTA